MRILLWLLRGIVFIALFGLAVKNSGPVDLRFYLDGVWQAPLSLVILGAFAIGTVVGLTATVMTLMRQGRELKRLRGRVDETVSADRVSGAK
jgi:lipopolysaccharide assembly protein A